MGGKPAEALPSAPGSVRFALSPKLYGRDSASSYAWWGNIAVVLGREPPDAGNVATYRACILDLLKVYPQGIGLITVVNGTSTPRPSGREALMALFREVLPRIDATLFVPNATGFQAAVLRSVMGCFILASGRRDRLKVEPSLSAGMPWLTTKLLGATQGRLQCPSLEKGIQQFCDTETAAG